MIDKMHSELSYYQKNKDRFKDVHTYFEKLFCNLYNLYSNSKKQFYDMIKDNSKNKNQIIDIINQTINYYKTIDRFENCQQLLEIRIDVTENLNKIFDNN